MGPCLQSGTVLLDPTTVTEGLRVEPGVLDHGMVTAGVESWMMYYVYESPPQR